jgi:dTDP-4-dehydrorhamnose reductase
VLLIGGTGLLGKALVQTWSSDEVIATSSRDADIRDEGQVRDLIVSCKPHCIVLAAAYTDVDDCERNPELAQQVNCIGAANVARVARETDSRLTFISTDYVFDGSKSTPYEVDDPVNPISVYGRSKANGEIAVRKIIPECCIVRTSWLFGAGRKCFPDSILALAQNHAEIQVVADQRGCPTFNQDAAQAIIRLIHADARGTIHATNAGECSRFEFAQEILRAAGLASVVVKPATSDEQSRPAPRPKYSVLSDASLKKYGISMRPWQEALRDYLAERLGSAQGKEMPATHH